MTTGQPADIVHLGYWYKRQVFPSGGTGNDMNEPLVWHTTLIMYLICEKLEDIEVEKRIEMFYFVILTHSKKLQAVARTKFIPRCIQ